MADPIPKALVHNTAQPGANTDILGSDLVPTNFPSTYGIEIGMSNSGVFSVAITNGGNTQVLSLNNGVALTAGALYIFCVRLHKTDSLNFRYSVTAGTIQVLRVQEFF